MKETKRRVELFSFYDRTGLEAHLARMAGRGWLLEKIGAFLWTYRKIEPRQLAFSVCYFPRASQFDPEPSQEQQTFYEFCAHTGWTLAASSAQLQVFYNERPDPIPIDTDPAVEVEAIHRAMKRGVLPSQALLLGVAVLNGALFVTRLLGDPIGVLASAANLFTGLCWVLIIALLGVEWTGYFSWRRKAVRAAQRGEFCQTRSRRKLQIASLVLLTIGLAYYILSVLSSGSRMMVTLMVLMFCVYIPAVFLLVFNIRGLLKRLKAPAGVNRAVSIAASLILSLAILMGITFGTFYAYGRGWLSRDADAAWLPLAVDELTGAERQDYIRASLTDQSLLLARFTAQQHPRRGAERYTQLPSLEYTVTLVKAPFLYDLCKSSLLHDRAERWNRDMPEGSWYFYEPADPAPWGAAEAYQWTSRTSGPWNTYLLCYPDRFVEIEFDLKWTPTPAQKVLAGERLGRDAV